MSTNERINVNITRIISPTKFWLRLQTDDHKNAPNLSHIDSRPNEPGDNLDWVKGIRRHFFFNFSFHIFKLIDLKSIISFAEWAEWKCHLAFVVPIDSICWSKTAIDKFKMYTKQFEQLSITIPNSVNSCAKSTPVILWASCDRNASAIDALDAKFDVWQNINLKMIFQGLARSNVHIAYLRQEKFGPLNNDNIHHMSLTQQHHHTNAEHKKIQQWSPAPPFRSKEFKGKSILIVFYFTIQSKIAFKICDCDRCTCVY